MKQNLPTLRRKTIEILLPGLLCLFAVAAPAQITGSSATTPRLQEHPLAELQRTQPPDADEYQLGGGDEIKVTVIGRPELSGSHIVGPDGRISLPTAGAVEVGGLSRDDAAKAVNQVLQTYYTDAQASVQVVKYSSNRIVLIGDVEHPGVLYFDGTPTLLEAITRGGALTGDDKAKRMPRSCIIYRGTDQIGMVNLQDVFRTGDVRLHRNDIIYVPGDQEKLVSVLGEVQHPGPVALREESTLVSLLTAAGGITEKAGNPMIQIINPKTGLVQTVKFKDLLTPRGKDLTLEVGDIVYVPRSGIARVGYFLQQIAPAAQIGTIGAVVGH